jgi:hypothetical protein
MSGVYVEIQSLVNQEVRISIVACKPLGLEAAQQALRKLNLNAKDPTNQGDLSLLNLSREQDDPGALLCLRCRISHAIRDRIQALYNQHHRLHSLDIIEMAGFVLDDSGALEFPARTGQRKGPPFCWSVLLSLEGKMLHPFSAEVLRSYNPARGPLPNWARQKVQCNAELKTYLKLEGVSLITDWALLAHKTSSSRLRQAWAEFGVGMGVEEAMALHRTYQCHYAAAKEAFVDRTGKRYGWQPDPDFLHAVLPALDPHQATEKLQDLATAVRRYLAGTAVAEGYPEYELADPATLHDSESPWGSADLMLQIHAALERAAQPAVRLAITDDQPSWIKKPERRLAWRFYGEGLGQRDIAERCQRKQGWVSKLLQEQSLATTIATAAAVELRRHRAFADVALSVEGAERLVAALRNHLTEVEREGEAAPLRRVVAQTLASMHP